MTKSTNLDPTGSLLFADEFSQPVGSLRASVHSLWVELQDGWMARRVVAQRRKATANGMPSCQQRANCGTLPKWQNR